MQYQVWQVFEQRLTRFYIVNIDSKSIQSAWRSYLEAKATCDKLNTQAQRGIV